MNNFVHRFSDRSMLNICLSKSRRIYKVLINDMIKDHKNFPLLIFVAQILGIDYCVSVNGYFGVYNALALCIALVYLIYQSIFGRENTWNYFLLILTIGFLFGFGTTKLKLETNKIVELSGRHLIVGKVSQIRPKREELVLTVDVGFIDSIERDAVKKVLLVVPWDKFQDTMINDKIFCLARFKKRSDWFLNKAKINVQDKINGISGVGYANKVYVDSSTTEQSFEGFTYRVRKSIYDSLVEKMGDNGHFIAALILGETGRISLDVLEAARNTGVAHILCVSGLHLSIVCLVFSKFTRFLLNCSEYIAVRVDAKKISVVVAAIASVMFLFISGVQIASTRACIMTSVVILGVLIDRGALSIRVIFFTGFLMLMFNPENLYQPSFQLSYIAVMGIIGATKITNVAKEIFSSFKKNYYELRYARKGRFLFHQSNKHDKNTESSNTRTIIEYCLKNIYISSVVSLVTLPIVIYHFYFFANYSKLTNLIIVPLASFVLMPLSIIGICLIPVHLDTPVFYILNYAVSFGILVMKYIQTMPEATYYMGHISHALMGLASMSFILFLVFDSFLKYISLAVFLALLNNVFSSPRPEIVVTHNFVILRHGKEVNIFSEKLNAQMFSRIINWMGAKDYKFHYEIPEEISHNSLVIFNREIDATDCLRFKNKRIINFHNNYKCKDLDVCRNELNESEYIE